ncbi:MAG: DNA-formamidopyrimidine glycosylase [Anaerolineae bacterium]|jgi:formamidopyrimidine-DNA glycosylase|nr:DNA-formamidopyrimidine glycosylase [Anaerolineae bacterium]
MPELPEVETVVRGIRPALIGRKIIGIRYDWRWVMKMPPDPEEFAARITGQAVIGVKRRAKYIVIELDQDLLVIHLKMTGRLYVVAQDADDQSDKYVHFRAQLDDGQELRFSDARKFGRVYLTSDFNAVSVGASQLGPEPLEETFTIPVFEERMRGRGKMIKALLMDQSFIAGVGNIYADEALFRAGIHPTHRSDRLNADQIARLYQTVRDTLNEGITHEGASVNWYRKPDGTKGSSQEYLYVYGRGNLPCRQCGTPIIKTRLAQRGTHYCPTCQPIDESE